MAFSYDPQIRDALQAMSGKSAQPDRGDWQAIRRNVDGQLAALRTVAPAVADVTVTQFSAIAADGRDIRLAWHAKAGRLPGSAVLYVHGGGMVSGSIDLYRPIVSRYVAASGVPILAVDYRLAPEHPHPIPVQDTYAALLWLKAQADALGFDPARIGVMGDSAGGGIAAAVSLLARDRGIGLAKQILIYPMLDDRTVVPDPGLLPFATWTYDNNATAWMALLGATFGTDSVPASAAVSRAADLAGVAPAYIDVGELDIFRDENVAYATRLAAASVSTELHVFAGAPHGFDQLAPDSDVARRAMAGRIGVLGGF